MGHCLPHVGSVYQVLALVEERGAKMRFESSFDLVSRVAALRVTLTLEVEGGSEGLGAEGHSDLGVVVAC